MRVLHVTDTYGPTVGGIEVMVQALAQSQVEAGHEVTVVTRTPGPLTSPGSEVLVRRDSDAFRSLVDGADVVHGHISAYSPLALRAVEAAARHDVPVVATVHSVWGSAWPLFRAAATVRGWSDLPIQWTAVSGVAAGPVRRAMPEREVMIVPNAVDTALWAPGPVRAPTDRVTIVSVMRMTRRKRPLQLLDALQRTRAMVPRHIGVDVVLVGDGPLRQALGRRIGALGMTSWVHMTGDQSHDALRTLYRGADIFVAPATLESFGLAALEARASGLAVVARAGTGVTEFVQDGVDGLLAHSDQQLSQDLAELCCNAALRRRMVHHNHLVRPIHDWSHVRELNTAAYQRAGATVGAHGARIADAVATPTPKGRLPGPLRLDSPELAARSSAA